MAGVQITFFLAEGYAYIMHVLFIIEVINKKMEENRDLIFYLNY